MKSTLFLVTAGALLAAASPLDKRGIEWVKEIVTVTVTVTDLPALPIKTPCSSSTAPPPKPTVPAPKHSQAPPPPPPRPAPPAPPAPAPPPPPPSSSSKSPLIPVPSAPVKQITDYQSTMLYHHNVHRSNHSSPDVQWDNTLAVYAHTIAATCVFAHDMHQGHGGYGQNIGAYGSTGNIANLGNTAGAYAVSNQWYDGEMINWPSYGAANPPQGEPLDDWGHFTQVVWKSSTKIGCATVLCPAGSVTAYPSWFTVCNYGPPGNFGGEYGQNVLPPLGHPTVSVKI